MAAAYLFCLRTDGGIPLYSRIKGNLKPLPFPVIGSLNGVHMFANTHDVSLLSTKTSDSKVIWKVFYDSITLILVTSDDHANDCHLNMLLDNVFQSMVLLCGLDELTNMKNVERFKKEIKICYHLVDTLLEQSDLPTFSDLTDSVDVIAGPENSTLQNYIDAFVEAAGSPYGCLLVRGKVAVATKKWWSLSSTELTLLAVLVSSLPTCTSRDIPVFLPQECPTVPHRLLTFQLTKDVEICVLCGSTPTLAQLEMEVSRFWKSSYDSLKSLSRLHPRNYPSSITLDTNTLGFLLINVDTRRCLCSVQPSEEDLKSIGKHLTTSRRKEILRSFYKATIGTFFTSTIKDSNKDPEEFSHKPLETYTTTDTHKCYALQANSYQFFVLYNTSIPTFAMRSITHKALQLLTKDKHVHV